MENFSKHISTNKTQEKEENKMKRNFCFITTTLTMCALFFFSMLAGVVMAQTPSGYVTRRDYHQNFDPPFEIDVQQGQGVRGVNVNGGTRVDHITLQSTLSSAGATINIQVTRAGFPNPLADWTEYVSSTIPKVYTHQAIVENPDAGLFPDGGAIQINYTIIDSSDTIDPPDTAAILNAFHIYLNSARCFDSGAIPTDACSDDCGDPDICEPDYCDPILDPGIEACATINTEEAGSVDALWYLGGCQKNISGTCNTVVWGYFYANPDTVSWGNINNPEVFAKIWFDESGRIDVNFFHVSVPDIEVYSSYGSPDEDSNVDETDTATPGSGYHLNPAPGGFTYLTQTGTVTLGTRYVRHTYEHGGSYSESRDEDGASPPGYWPNDNPQQYEVTTPLLRVGIGAMVNTVQRPMGAIWRQMGRSAITGGNFVVWGYFHLGEDLPGQPPKIFWGHIQNPELFVKVWYDHTGRVDVNFFHVSVPDIEVYSTKPVPVQDSVGDYDYAGMTTMDNRYVRFDSYSGTTPWPSPWP
ncbi:MAG: hypothetical protein DRI57_14160 [Deltaproteobacteria bacterium]|nr:MAG: hypothetical protein DRI57_14160 [Deltaproteobacteria bacterium]